MSNKIDKLFESTAGLLSFALLSGCGYFFFLLSVIINFSRNQSPLIGFFFAPAIICGAALFIVKTVKNNIEAEENKKNHMLFYLHTIVILVGIVFLTDIIL